MNKKADVCYYILGTAVGVTVYGVEIKEQSENSIKKENEYAASKE